MLILYWIELICLVEQCQKYLTFLNQFVLHCVHDVSELRFLKTQILLYVTFHDKSIIYQCNEHFEECSYQRVRKNIRLHWYLNIIYFFENLICQMKEFN